jgi:hypothetical protein
MTFIPLIPRDKLTFMTDDEIRGIDAMILTSTDRDPDWDAAFEARVSIIPGCDSLILDLKDPIIMTDRTKDESIKKRYSALLSDVERITVFGAGTRVATDKIIENKARLSVIFLLLGPDFQQAHSRAKSGMGMKNAPTSSQTQDGAAELRFVSGRK